MALMKMTTTERLVRFETAQETIGFLMALRTTWISDERARPVPDLAKIARWSAERDRYWDEQEALSYDDETGIERVIQDYAPLVRAAIQQPPPKFRLPPTARPKHSRIPQPTQELDIPQALKR